MTILDNILARWGYAKADKLRPPDELLAMAEGQRWDMPEATVAEKQARLYAALTWIATAVDRVAEIGSTAVYSVKRTGAALDSDDDDEDIPNHPFELLLRKPNPMQSRSEFLRDALSWYKVTGNLYLHLNKPNADAVPGELWIIPSHMIKPVPDGQSYIKGYLFEPPGVPRPLPLEPWEVLHLKTWNPLNAFVGLSAIQSLALDGFGDVAQQKWNLKVFDKDNGTLPIVLAFKHMIDNTEWARMKKERESRDSVMMLRGVGDTVQLLQAASTRKEMDFLAGRTFTKEEIYGKLAPGLASILAVNATEANAKVGERILITHGVWPMLEQLAQKLSADVLPLYGENLVGAFDDIRPRESAEEEKFFTINEIRQRRYKAPPLYLDESQVTALEEDMAQAEENKQTALAQLNQAKADPPSGKKKQQLDPRGLMFVAQIGPATPLAGDATKPPAPPPLPPVAPADKPADDGMPDKEQAADELAKWEKFEIKRVGKGGRAFEPRVVDVFTAGRIRAALKTAQTADDVRAVFAQARQPDPLADAVAELRRFNDLAGTH